MQSPTSTTRATALHVLFLAHDVGDAAVARRIAMLQRGGAEVALAGFRRAARPLANVEGLSPCDLGGTRNGGFAQRILMVILTLARIRRLDGLFLEADVVIARNLEMLALAVAGAARCRKRPVVIYEALDIHRLMLDGGAVGRALRWLERRLVARAQAIFTSSPAFVREYFLTRNPVRLPMRLIENKPLQSALPAPETAPRRAAPPWVIGWFGMIRCRKSLDLLAQLASQMNGKVEVVIRGKPSLDQMPDFHERVAAAPHVRFEGPYSSPGDLAAIYREIHFSWAIDMFEEGLNSAWLLPNRLYEGGYFNAVPLAIEDVETGRALKKLDIGVRLTHPLEDAMTEFFAALTTDAYARLAAASRAVPTAAWVCTDADCLNLVAYVAALRESAHG